MSRRERLERNADALGGYVKDCHNCGQAALTLQDDDQTVCYDCREASGW